MTDQNGEDSPTNSSEEIGVSPKVVDSVSPNVCPVDHRGGRVEVQESTSKIEMEFVAPKKSEGDGDLQPVVEDVPAEAEAGVVVVAVEFGGGGSVVLVVDVVISSSSLPLPL